MAVNEGVLPPLQSQQFVDVTGRLTNLGLQFLQSMQTAINAVPIFPTISSPTFANDAAAAAGGIAVGQWYRNASNLLQMRVV
jgi:hypothetical protein